jgi:effector-binding domain-containing protein
VTDHIETRTLTVQDTAVVRASLPAGQLLAWLAGAYEEVSRYLTDRAIQTDGPPFARYVFHGDVVDVEAGFPVPRPVPSGSRVVASQLPGGSAVAITVHGGYENLARAHRAVSGWLEERGLKATGPHWDVYYTNPAAHPPPAVWRTDVVSPYRAG